MKRVGLCLLALLVSLLAIADQAHAVPVPELDPGSASMGIALLAGALVVLNGRRKR